LDLHQVNKNRSATPRIIISYGFLIPEEHIEDHTIKNNTPNNWVELKNNVYYNKTDKLIDNMPSPVSLLNFHSMFCIQYGLRWWSHGMATKKTLRFYLENGNKA
jgi:hypothetical protein